MEEQRASALTGEQVEGLCRVMGWPRPVSVRILGSPGRTASHGFRFDELPEVVVQVDQRLSTHGAAAEHLLAADAWLGAVGLPTRDGLVRIPTAVLRAPAVAFRHRELATGLRLCALDPSHWSLVARDLAAVHERCSAQTTSAFGTVAHDGELVPQRGNWADEWICRSLADWQIARQFGVDLGPLSEALHRAVVARRDALASVRHHAFVHGELKPAALLYDLDGPLPRLAGIDHLEASVLGDPLVDFGFLLAYEPTLLAPILAAFGPDRIRSLFEPDALARIEAYHFTTLASRPRHVAEEVRGSGATHVLASLETAREHAEQALEPGFVRSRLEAALSCPPPYAPAFSPDRPWAARGALRVAAGLVRGEDGLAHGAAPVVAAALGAAVVAHRHEGDPLRSTACLELSTSLARRVRTTGRTEWLEPIPDRERWLRALVSDMAECAAAAPLSTAGLVLCWLVAETLRTLGPTVSDSCLRGLEHSVRRLAVQDCAADGHPGERAQVALLGLAAALELEEAGHGPFPSLRELLAARVRVGLGVDGLPARPVGDGELLAQVVTDERVDRIRSQRPLRVLALQALVRHGWTGDPIQLLEAVEQVDRATPRG
jgi:hypothetical protein